MWAWIALSAVLVTVLFAGASSAADKDIPYYELDREIIVTATRIPTAFPNLVRAVVVLDRAEIENTPVGNIQDLLKYIAGNDVRQYGVDGVLADVGIRGATFEQTLVLLDGQKISDPQTGHHNFNLPIDINDVERIEILKGHGSRLYGPNAFGGVINVITRSDTGKAMAFKTDLGEYNSYGTTGILRIRTGPGSHHVSLSKRASDGYRENTGYDVRTVSYRGFLDLGRDRLYLTTAHTAKEFGANSFFGSSSTRQWEETRTTYYMLKLSVKRRSFTFAPRIFWRRNEDRYIWNREHPEWYENRHTTHAYGTELQVDFHSLVGATSLGLETGVEDIKSNALGEHERSRTGLYFEHNVGSSGGIQVSLGASAFYYSDWGWQVWPGVDVGYTINRSHRL